MSRRVEDAFTILKKIRGALDDSHVLVARVLQEAAGDRMKADELLTFSDVNAVFEFLIQSGPQKFHALCLALLEDRERLARQLETIRNDLKRADLPPRRDNQGESGRGRAQP